MAQVVKLKRSSVAGNVPTTGQMAAGELAMNTADGKLFLRDDSTVRPILTTGAEITGSLNLTGDVSASNILVIGTNNLSSNYALKVQNSSGTDLLKAENDGKVYLRNPSHTSGDINSTGSIVHYGDLTLGPITSNAPDRKLTIAGYDGAQVEFNLHNGWGKPTIEAHYNGTIKYINYGANSTNLNFQFGESVSRQGSMRFYTDSDEAIKFGTNAGYPLAYIGVVEQPNNYNGGLVIKSRNGTTQTNTWTFGRYGDLDAPGNISASGHVSASTYYGDGSNLTGISSGGTVAGSQYQIQFNDGSNFDAGDGFLFDKTNKIVRVGTSEPGSSGTIANNDASGSHIFEDGKELITNAKVANDDEIVFLLGLGNQTNTTQTAGGGSYTHSNPAYAMVNTGQVYQDEHPGTVVNGSLTVTEPYVHRNTLAGRTTLYIDRLVKRAFSPSIHLDDGILIYASESITYDADGTTQIQPESSASVRIDLAQDSSSLNIKVGKENLKDVLFISESNGSARIGVGFSPTEKLIKPFEVKSKLDSAEGSEFLIRSSRISKGAETGDSGGSVRFAIDSASFGEVTTSGSVATIDTEITTVETTGVTGDLIFKVAESARLEPTEILRLNGDNNRAQLTGSFYTTKGTVLGTNKLLHTHTLTGNTTITGSLYVQETGSFAHVKATTIEGNSPLNVLGVSNLTFADPGDGVTFSNTNLFGNPIFHGDINIYSGSAMLDEIDQVIFRSTNTQIPADGYLQLGDASTPTELRGDGITLKSDTIISGSIEFTGTFTGPINGGTF